VSERWLSQLQKIDRVEPSYGLLERAEAGPFLPEPGPRPMARAVIVVFAALVAAAGTWGAFAALRGVGGTDGVAGGRDPATFQALWPETRLSDAQEVQERLDAGDPAVQWRIDAADVALRYARGVFGWPDPIASVRAGDDPDMVYVDLFGPIASCSGAACEVPQPQQIGLNLTLERVVRSGDGGIWSVTLLGPMSEPIGEDRPRIGGWPEDADGDGLISDSGEERIPALIRAVGDHGVTGYVRYADIEGNPQPSDPEEAVATSGQERVIPVYAEDGMTVVDWYTLSAGDGSPTPSGDAVVVSTWRLER